MASSHDFAEITRSALEASKTRLLDVDLARYQNPPADTCYPLEYAFYLLGDVQNKVVVDLGCGSGEEVIPLRQRGARVIGMDISPDLIAIAHERLQKYGVDAELRVASAYETQLPDESADVVFCMSLLHHLQLDRAKNEIRRILKPDVAVYFQGTNPFLVDVETATPNISNQTRRHIRIRIPSKFQASEPVGGRVPSACQPQLSDSSRPTAHADDQSSSPEEEILVLRCLDVETLSAARTFRHHPSNGSEAFKMIG